MKQSIRDILDTLQSSTININKELEEDKTNNGAKAILKEIMAKNFQKIMENSQ